MTERIAGDTSAMQDFSGAPNLPRRQFLAGLGAVAAGMAFSGRGWAAQSPGSNPGWIDVHSHFSGPRWSKYFAEKAKRGFANPGSNAVESALTWSPAELLSQMDRAGIAASVLSMTFPGIYYGPNEDSPQFVRDMARELNDSIAKLVSEHPKRVGLFAVLPLPDIDGSLREIEYAYDTLKADGVGMLTNYDDKWLGDPSYAPVFQELNRRKAIIYTHPRQNKMYGPGGADTNRALTSLLKDDTSMRYPDVRLIFAHGGGFMPYRIENYIGSDDIKKRLESPAAPGTPLAELRRFYYDTAQSANPATMAALRKVIPISQILFGTDYNYAVRDLPQAVKQMQEDTDLNAEQLRVIGRENALRLFPRFKA